MIMGVKRGQGGISPLDNENILLIIGLFTI